jgi:outer membrane lipoprotein carrier protein
MGALVAIPLHVGAAPADVDALGDLLRPVTTLSAQFTQIVLGGHLEVLQRGEGMLEIERPGKFRWETKAPYPQLIVTAGEHVYVYDEDLAQVQIRPIDEAFDGTPARVLAGEIDALAQEFDVSRIEPSADPAFRLTPHADGAPYRELRLTFSGDKISQIEVVDSLGQLTQVQLYDVIANQPIDASRFVFEIPSGVDVIGERPDAP